MADPTQVRKARGRAHIEWTEAERAAYVALRDHVMGGPDPLCGPCQGRKPCEIGARLAAALDAAAQDALEARHAVGRLTEAH